MPNAPTSDHEEILRWAARNEAVPAEIRPFANTQPRPYIPHFLLGTARVGIFELRPISWDEFFDRLDHQHLAVLCSEQSPFGSLPLPPIDTVRECRGI